MMSLDDRAADRQADSHSIGLRCIESFKKFVRAFRREPDSRIAYAKMDPIALIPSGLDQQLLGATVNAHHRVRCVSYQVQDHLLELDTIADDQREVLREF